MNFAVVNLGCKVNRVESDAAAAVLLAQGASPAREEDADLIVVNTCTVTGEAEKKTRKAVRRALRTNPTATVVVTGCAAAVDAAFYESLDERVECVAKAALSARVRKLANDMGARSPLVASLPVGAGFRSRVGVKVQDGCDNACTYCIVHVARGRATSRPADEVTAECVALAAAGVREIVLTGINLGSYCDGAKRDASAMRLAGLLRRLLGETERLRAPGELPCRFRISSVEPRDVDDALVDLLATADGRICRHLHLPLQSGSSKVLREMARPYDADQFRALVERLHAAVPGLALSTDIIAGFPGETDVEFQETLELARAYHTLADGGVDRPLVWSEKARPAAGTKVISAEGAALVLDILKDTRRNLPLYGEADADGKIVAFKTGTSYGLRDAWTAAVTKKWTLIVWFGDPSGRPHRGLVGLRAAAPSAVRIMLKLTRKGAPWFTLPPAVVKKELCALSGAPRNQWCPQARRDLFIEGVSDGEPCLLHTAAGGKIAIKWPAELETFFAGRGGAGAEKRLVITSPKNGAIYTKGAITEKIALSSEGGRGVIYWFADGELIGDSGAGAPLAWTMAAGSHKIAAADEYGAADEIEITVKRAAAGEAEDLPLLEENR